MNFINRLPSDALDTLMHHASKVQVTLHRYDDQLYGSFHIEGDLCGESADDGDTIDKPDLRLLRELLNRFEAQSP